LNEATRGRVFLPFAQNEAQNDFGQNHLKRYSLHSSLVILPQIILHDLLSFFSFSEIHFAA